MTTIEPSVPRQANAVLGKRLHLSAIEQIRASVDSFAIALILRAKIKAYEDKAEVVLSRHVEEALDQMVRGRQKNWWKEALKVVGAVLLGVSVPGLGLALPAYDVLLTVLYVGLGFAGALLVFLGFLV